MFGLAYCHCHCSKTFKNSYSLSSVECLMFNRRDNNPDSPILTNQLICLHVFGPNPQEPAKAAPTKADSQVSDHQTRHVVQRVVSKMPHKSRCPFLKDTHPVMGLSIVISPPNFIPGFIFLQRFSKTCDTVRLIRSYVI